MYFNTDFCVCVCERERAYFTEHSLGKKGESVKILVALS